MAGQHGKVTGFSGNEIYCLNKLGYAPGQLCLGNNVISLGVVRGFGAGLSNLAGGEVTEITNLVHEGRQSAYDRMMKEAEHYGGVGLAGITFELINHVSNLEFVATGSTVRNPGGEEKLSFSTAADGQQLYCQMDSGFKPHSFVFGNVAYSIGLGGSIGGVLRGLARGEVPQYTQIFDRTRHLALNRIKQEAKRVGANAVIGIQTSVMPLLGAQEMLMMGTASSHPALNGYAMDPVTSDMTNEELWNIVNMGYMPISLVMGVSVYSLGLASGITTGLKSLVGGQVHGLTELLYEAREKALERVQLDAQKCGADEVVGVKTKIYDMGGGLVEFMVIGTAIKKMPGVTTKNQNLIPQAIIQDRDTYIESISAAGVSAVAGLANGKASSARAAQTGPISIIVTVIIVIFYILSAVMGGGTHHR
jgi:uncharacterized protein YbjQ (UPF0145 family)